MIIKHGLQYQKIKINVFKYMRLAANVNKYANTITYVYRTFRKVHILLIVIRCVAQNLFGTVRPRKKKNL